MFRISRLHQILQLLPWGAFDGAVKKHRSDRHCKGFSSRDHLVTMLYAQLSGCASLRQLEASFNQHARQHYHLGVDPVKRSTLADANRTRNSQVLAELAQALMQRAGGAVRREREFMLYLLDSTSIPLTGRGFEWTGPTATRTPGLKLHLLYTADGSYPVHHSITCANVNDVTEGAKLAIEPGATYVFDKGYCDYNWWARITAAGARLVTRLKSNAALCLVSDVPIDAGAAAVILSDQVMRFAHKSNRGGHRNHHQAPVRRLQVARPGQEPLTLLTNDLCSSATEIAQLYKERWQIELYFKWIKQHLSVKRFLGRSENAVRIQLLVALIAYLLVLLYKATHGLKATLWHVLAELRGGLMHPVEPTNSPWQERKRQRAYAAAVQPLLL
jgi:putative transposase